MPDVPLSEGLRVALRSGAEIGMSKAILQGGFGQSVLDYISARLGDLTATEVGYITDLANAMLAAGEYIDSLDDLDTIDPDRIPTNGELFGDEPGGKRLHWWGEWTPDKGEHWFQFSGDLPDISDKSQIIVAALQEAERIAKGSPEIFEEIIGHELGTIEVRILGPEKAF